MTPKSGQIRIGIGGWTFEPWRGVFYPKGLPQSKELAYASERLTSIEVNGTFYRTQTPATFRKWASEVPPGFVFALKGPRFAINRRVLKDAGDSIKRFLDSGVIELGDHLGPLLWQFAPTKKFDAADFGGFLELLPRKIRAARAAPCHRSPARQFPHAGIRCAAARVRDAGRLHRPRKISQHRRSYRRLRLCPFAAGRRHGADRLSRRKTSMPGPAACKPGRKAERAEDLPRVDTAQKPKTAPRDVFAYVIHEGKIRAPAGAMALIERLKD